MTSHSLGRTVHAVFDRYLLLPAGVIVALIWAHVAADTYFSMSIRLSFLVNEVGMALFLGLVMQEVMDATLPGGPLHTWRRWLLPLAAAAGGVAGSALVYLAYVKLAYETVLGLGWPIATAVDLAAAYFVLKLIFPRTSPAYPFLLLAAVASNAFALSAIAVRHFSVATVQGAPALLLAAVVVAALLRRRHVRAFWPYLAICAPISWLGFYWSGLHPALALIPIAPFLPHRRRGVDLLEDPDDRREHTRRIEHEWAVVVQPIVFLFGLVNGGVPLTAYGTGTWALLTAGLVGRPLGMLAAVALAAAAGLQLPSRLAWRDLAVTCVATTSGFTLALFAATAVFPIGPLLGEAKLGALLTATGALVTLVLARLLPAGRFHTRAPVDRRAPHARVRHALVVLLLVAGWSLL
ncbi:MAG: Na+/H+ antiporter NhaA [Vicinamibacterales bacterium]